MPDDSNSLEITPVEVRRRMDSGEPIFLVDVRESQEHAICRIDGSELIPVSAVPGSLPMLESKADEMTLVVFCHHGMRSMNVVNWLRGQGITNCQSMAGGIDRWSLEVDPSVPRY